MGEVWRARDTKLGREVAIKTLPAEFSQDADRLARFEREAKLLASLNQPNIAAIYGLEEHSGIRFLVLELVEGPTLEDRIKQGAISVEESLKLALQIAEALEAAHDKGVIHRDLKPANVKVRSDGTVKVLDFGLAKAMEPSAVETLSASLSPTITTPAMTQAGLILGTAAYMSPEQVEGGALDTGSDAWAFGVVCFEMLTGQSVFGGDTFQRVLASVLQSEPSWNLLPATLPDSLVTLLRRCLDKRQKQRLRDMREVRIAIDAALADVSEGGRRESSDSKPGRQPLLPWAVAVLVAIMAVAYMVYSPSRMTDSLALQVALPPGQHVRFSRFTTPFAISPDGQLFAYVAANAEGDSQIYLRRLNGTFTATPVSGTEGAEMPFFSPDSAWLGFHVASELRKVPVAGGLPRRISDAPEANSADWGNNGDIVFDSGLNGLYVVSADGGEPRQLTVPDYQQSEHQIGYPHFLPDGTTILFTAIVGTGSRIGVIRSDAAGRQILPEPMRGQKAQYFPGGFLLYSEANRIMAVPFDPEQLTVVGQAIPVAEDARLVLGVQEAPFDVSDTGVLLYVPEVANAGAELVWVDREGRADPLGWERLEYMYPRLSPDDQRVAVAIGSDIGPGLRIFDLFRGGDTRFTGAGGGIYPVWSTGGDRLIFASQLSGNWGLHWKDVTDVSGNGQQLVSSRFEQLPTSSGPDGAVTFVEVTPETGQDIWALYDSHDAANRSMDVILNTRFRERSPMLSPDGTWLAYVSDQSGRDEVWAQRFPSGEDDQLVSVGGGLEPIWSRDGRELFYRVQNRMMTVSFDPIASEFAPPVVLFDERYESEPFQNIPYYDVDSDGRFLMIRRDASALPTHFNVVTNVSDVMNQELSSNSLR